MRNVTCNENLKENPQNMRSKANVYGTQPVILFNLSWEDTEVIFVTLGVYSWAKKPGCWRLKRGRHNKKGEVNIQIKAYDHLIEEYG